MKVERAAVGRDLKPQVLPRLIRKRDRTIDADRVAKRDVQVAAALEQDRLVVIDEPRVYFPRGTVELPSQILRCIPRGIKRLTTTDQKIAAVSLSLPGDRNETPT